MVNMTGLSYVNHHGVVIKPLTSKGQRILRVLVQKRRPDEKLLRELPLSLTERHKVVDMWSLMHTISTPDEVINAPELQCGFDIE